MAPSENSEVFKYQIVHVTNVEMWMFSFIPSPAWHVKAFQSLGLCENRKYNSSWTNLHITLAA